MHPLLNLKRLPEGIISVNALMVDLTELWDYLHKDNVTYMVYGDLTKKDLVSFKVFGHLAGNPFIWYSIIPKHIKETDKITPNIFFLPSDNAELQNNADDEKYLLNNDAFFKKDGRALIKYLLPPIDDVRIEALKSNFDEEILKERRNVLNFKYVDKAKTKFSPLQWNISMGLEKSFYGLGEKKPMQILLIPQNVGSGAQSIKGAVILKANSLKIVTDTITNLLFTNSDILYSQGSDKMKSNDKMIFSCYSESGFDLWFACTNNLENLKAIIAVEPQNLNSQQNNYGMNPPVGKDVIPKLVDKKVQIYLIGRHHTRYKPLLSQALADKINFLPDKNTVSKIFQYPPDPDSNNFVKYRINRIIDSSSDPFILDDEKDILDKLSKKKPPVTGKDILKVIFTPLNDEDSSEHTQGIFSTWYSHQYSLSGGQIMNLPASGSIYNQAVTYLTFFQETLEKIG
jgi:hypothetical protein